ncbi:hypothetical protein [Photobacterium profundum]|uniref:Uncharacterized protein n=1 Tax=Photobacterium profundum (strain SS9) TaxID=298386 RepID=Q6LID3_PHOPR|nr:hypothetical protein [Photobacterium profundum]CAG22947.1 hypothetical protein PBPRB1075 [Photobacterium profundum SS9]
MTTELPDDIEQLKQMLAKLQHENQVHNTEVRTLSSQNKDLESRLNIALEQLKLNRKNEFASRSEKIPKGTFNEAEESQTENKPRNRKGRKALPEHLAREEKSYVIETPT